MQEGGLEAALIMRAARSWFLLVTFSWAHTHWGCSAGSPPTLTFQREHFLSAVLCLWACSLKVLNYRAFPQGGSEVITSQGHFMPVTTTHNSQGVETT